LYGGFRKFVFLMPGQVRHDGELYLTVIKLMVRKGKSLLTIFLNLKYNSYPDLSESDTASQLSWRIISL
jgi:hypothetical protein